MLIKPLTLELFRVMMSVHGIRKCSSCKVTSVFTFATLNVSPKREHRRRIIQVTKYMEKLRKI